MALEGQSNNAVWIQPSTLAPLPFLFRALLYGSAGFHAGVEPAPLPAAAGRAGASNLEGEGGVSALAAAPLEGVAPQIDVVDVGAAATEAPRDGIASPLSTPLPGVARTGVARGAEFEELTDRYGHARTALAALVR